MVLSYVDMAIVFYILIYNLFDYFIEILGDLLYEANEVFLFQI